MQASKHTIKAGVPNAKPLTEDEKKAALARMLAQKHETLFQGILFNTLQAGTFGKDLSAAVDAAETAADHAMEIVFGAKRTGEKKEGDE